MSVLRTVCAPYATVCVYICERPTRAGGVGLILIFATIVVSITQPAQRDTAVVLTLKPVRWTRVLVCGREKKQEIYNSRI